MEFHEHIWNHREKYIQKSTNMPGICTLIREIDVKNQTFGKSKDRFSLSITNARVLSVNHDEDFTVYI